MLPRHTRPAIYPVAAVPAPCAISAQSAQLEFQEVLDHGLPAAIVQPPLDDLIPAHIGLFPAFIDVLVDEQHPPFRQKASQQLPELSDPASRHVREPRREEDHVEAGARSRGNTSATSKLTLADRTLSRAIATGSTVISGAGMTAARTRVARWSRT